MNLATNINPTLLFVIYAWSIIWKGIALWRAARDNQRNWFIAILVINIIGLLEITYLFFFAKKKLTFKSFSDLKFWGKK